MNAVEALRRLRDLRVPVLTTADAAAALRIRLDAASQTLRRLRAAGLVFSVRKGLWAIDALPDRMALVELVTAPYPAYVSMQSALFRHGMVEQIPAVVYVASLGRSAAVQTAAGAFSVHHLPPELFGDFDAVGYKLARPEKALFDLLYLSGTRSRRFASTPELELPAGFRVARVRRWIGRISSQRLRTLVAQRLEAVLARATPSGAAAGRRAPARPRSSRAR